MLELIWAILATLFFSIDGILTKTTINQVGRYKALVYCYLFFIPLFVLGALVLGLPFTFPLDLIPAYIAQVIIGAMAIILYFKAIEDGKVSILAPLSNLYVLVVMVIGIFLLSETVSPMGIIGSLIIVLSAVIIAFADMKKFKLETGVLYLVLTIFGWGYYYSFIKIFVSALGFYMATFYLEIGIAIFIFFYYLLKKKDLMPPSLEHSKHIFARSLLGFLGANFLNVSVASIGVALTAGVNAGSPMIQVILSYVILKEKLNLPKYAAIALMITGLVIIAFG